MLVRTLVAFALLLGFLATGALVQRLRRSGQPVVRAVAGRVHFTVGVVAVAFLALLGVIALQLLLD